MKPIFKKDYYCYEDLIDSMELDILFEKHDDDYSGDYRYLIENKDNKIGILVFGYGSCSGCDELEACNSHKEVVKIRNKLYNSIVWFGDNVEFEKYVDWNC